MTKLLASAVVSLAVVFGLETAHAQTPTPAPPSEPVPATDTVSVAQPAPAADTAPIAEPAPAADTAPAAQPAGPYRTDTVEQPSVPCVRQVRRIPPPPSPRSFRRQWPLAAVGAVVGWLAADRVVGPKGNQLVILSSSTIGAVAGSHMQATREGHPNLGRSILGGLLGAVPAGAALYMNGADVYDEAEIMTRGVVPVLGGSVQAAVTAAVTSSSLQPSRIQIIECPHVSPGATLR